jgi:hypothetical protein
VRQNVRSFLSDIQSRLPHTPLILMSGMAEGADQLAAQTALDLGIEVLAVLPMPKALYRADFDDEAWGKLTSLLSNPLVTTMELPLPLGLAHDDVFEQGAKRDQLYSALGDFLLQRSHMILALWDGLDAGLQGGTSEVLISYLGGVEGSDTHDVRFVNDLESYREKDNVAFWIPTQRRSSKNAVPQDFPCYVVGTGRVRQWCLLPELPLNCLEDMEALDTYNQDYQELSALPSPPTPYPLSVGLPEDGSVEITPWLKQVEDEYLKTDGLAMFNQGYSDRLFRIFAYMAASMGFFFLFYAKIYAAKVFLILYLGLFLVGYWSYRRSKEAHWFSKHLMYRVAAETMRVRFFAGLSGLGHQVNISELMNLTGVDQFQGFGWLKSLLKNTEIPTDESTPTDEALAKNIEYVSHAWVRDQDKYFQKKVAHLSHRHHQLEKIKSYLLMSLVVATLALLLFKKTLIATTLGTGVDMKTWIVFLMGLLPLFLGIWEIYQGQMATKELLWQYKKQSEHFAEADKKIEAAKDVATKQEILTELARKSLMEIYLWTIHRYHREHEPPSAG